MRAGLAPPAMSVRQRLFTGLVRLGKLSEVASQAFLFLGVGLLRRSDFKDLSLRSWSAYARTDDEARSGLTAWEEATFRQFVKAGDRLCIVGCGSGRDLLPFVRDGHDVVGIEPSPAPAAMLRRILRETSLSATVIEAHVEDADAARAVRCRPLHAELLQLHPWIGHAGRGPAQARGASGRQRPHLPYLSAKTRRLGEPQRPARDGHGAADAIGLAPRAVRHLSADRCAGRAGSDHLRALLRSRRNRA